MGNWKFFKYVKPNGRCPIDDWIESKEVTKQDLACMDALIETLEKIPANKMFPPEKLKKYHGTELYELKVRANKKQLRPLSVKDDKLGRVILLSGAIEKGGKIPKGDIETAKNLKSDLQGGHGGIDEYFKSDDNLEAAN